MPGWPPTPRRRRDHRRGCIAHGGREEERSGVISTGRRHLHFLGFGGMRRVLEDGPARLPRRCRPIGPRCTCPFRDEDGQLFRLAQAHGQPGEHFEA